MNIIEKLEALQRYEQGRHGEMQKAETYHSAKYISDHDLRAIIEEYKKQEISKNLRSNSGDVE